MEGAGALDRILFPNGDSLSGRVVSEDESTVVFETEFLGILQVPRSHVIVVRTPSDPAPSLLPEAPSMPENLADIHPLPQGKPRKRWISNRSLNRMKTITD
jgi:hypothetical protein